LSYFCVWLLKPGIVEFGKEELAVTRDATVATEKRAL
jgi:hypothetical protein